MTTYNIEALPGPNNSESQAFGVNKNGEVAGDSFPADGIEGVLWLAKGTVVPLMPDSYSILYSVNDAGDAVGVRGFDNTSTETPILVRAGVSADLDGALGVGSICVDINNAGVLCGSNLNNNPNAFTYDTLANKLTLIPVPGAQTHAYAAAISQAGQVVGVVRNTDQTSNGFYYDGTLRDLGSAAFVEDINNNAQVVGSVGAAYPASFAPVIWDVAKNPPPPQPIPLPASDAFIGAHASGINDQGIVVGTCWTAGSYDGDQAAYVYADGSSTDLNSLISAPGWHLRYATDINNAGMIVGLGTFNGQQTAFLLTPVDTKPKHIIPIQELVAAMVSGGVKVDAGGWGIIGGVRAPIGPWGPEGWASLPGSQRDALVGLALGELANQIADAKVRKQVRNAILEGVKTSVGATARGVQPKLAYRRPSGRLRMGKSTGALRLFGME